MKAHFHAEKLRSFDFKRKKLTSGTFFRILQKRKDMKKRFRLTEEEIELLGFSPETKSNQFRLDEEQQQTLLQERNGFQDDTTGYKNTVDQSGVMSAIGSDGKAMSIEQYCTYYGLDFSTVRSFRLMNHLTPARYSIVFHTNEVKETEEEKETIKEHLEGIFQSIKYERKSSWASRNKVGVVNVADLHLGAYIDGLRNTPSYSITILIDRLHAIADIINGHDFSEVHVHVLGDLIESFSGLNHKNVWKGLAKGMHGAELIKFTTKVLHEHFFSLINNLSKIKIIGGNHDRFSHDNTIDNEGGVADVITWALDLIGYDVEFDSLVLNNVVDGVSYVLLHGDKGISKRKAKEIIFDYGKQGVYNVILEAHLHSLIVKEDSHNCVRMHVRSLFTGNAYSEELGFTSTAGFTLFVNEGSGVPNMFNYNLK
jgi:hypothetical protein